MTQERINKMFTSSLGMQCLSLFTTEDDAVFIRHEEAVSHSNLKGFDINLIEEWFDENDMDETTEGYSELFSEIFAFIQEKAESRGWENAEHFACEKYGEGIVKDALNYMGHKTYPNNNQCYNSISAAIEILEKEHSEFMEENTTGWDMMKTLRHIREHYKTDSGMYVKSDLEDMPF